MILTFLSRLGGNGLTKRMKTEKRIPMYPPPPIGGEEAQYVSRVTRMYALGEDQLAGPRPPKRIKVNMSEITVIIHLERGGLIVPFRTH